MSTEVRSSVIFFSRVKCSCPWGLLQSSYNGAKNIWFDRVSYTPGNLLELFFLLEILEIFWKFAKSSGNFLAEFACLLLL